MATILAQRRTSTEKTPETSEERAVVEAVRGYVEAALPAAERLFELAERLTPGEWGCPRCSAIGRPAEQFPLGEGRDKGRHPEHRYCKSCGLDIDWSGCLTYERHQYHKRPRAERAS